MNNLPDLEFHPYYGEGITPDFQYDKNHQDIIDFFNNDAQKCVEELISKAFTISVEKKIIGYIAISFKSIGKNILTRRKQTGKFDRPALVIGQLIFDSRYQKRGFGKRTILWVISIVKMVQKFLPLRLLFVDAIDEEAKSFYLGRGFELLKGNDESLVLDLLPILKTKK